MSPQTDIYSQTSYAHTPMQQYSPGDQDFFAAHGKAQQQHQPQQQQPQLQQQQQLTYQPQQQLDPWAAMLAPPTFPTTQQQQQQQQHAAPMPSHMQAPPPPAPAPQAKQQLTPPPTMYVGGTMCDVSPLGDVSVLAAAFGNQGVSVPPAQPLRPQPQPASAAIVAANPFDFDAMGSSMPAPPEGKPPTPQPTPPRDVHQQEQQVQLQATAPFVVAPAANPFGYSCASPTPQYNASPPMSPVPQAQAYGAPMGVTAQQQYATSPNQQQQHQQQAAAQYPAYSFSPQQGHDDPFGYAFSPFSSPVVSPGSNSGGAMMMITATADNHDPFGRPPYMPGTSDCQAMVPSLAVNEDPFGVMFGGGGSNGRNDSTALVSAPASDDPFGMGVLGGSSSSSALVPSTSTSNNAYDDPFGGMFGSSTIPVAVAVAAPRSSVASSAGNGYAAASSSPSSSSRPPIDPRLEHAPEEKPIALDTNGLPSDGEYYEARINARSLGTMFYTARNLEDTLFLRVPNNVVEALGSRPVVSYVAENSAAHHAGVNLGHVILSVNGESVANPEYCAGMIRNSPRPIVLRCYAPPELELTVTEGLHKVAYHNKDLEAPVSLSDWKEKFVVVGGIVTKPYMMNMFYKKADYDTAVKEAHAGQQISVKVKQFDLRGARVVLKGMDGVPNRIVYPSQRKPWYFIVVVPNKGYPVKISSESLDALEPIYAGIRRFVNKDMENRYSARMQESFDTLRSRKY